MTESARVNRDFRHANERAVGETFGRTWAGKRSRVGQIKAAARKILMNETASVRRTLKVAG